MNKVTLRQTLIPLITIAIICFFWFGPISIRIENIIVSIVIIIANYIEYEGKPFSALGFQREKFTSKNILVLAPLVALGLFLYFMRQFVKFFGESKISIVLNIVLICSFFGFMHSYQGITGQLVATIVGSLLALIFYLRKYDLWFVIAVHGFFNTIALACIYFGLSL